MLNSTTSSRLLLTRRQFWRYSLHPSEMGWRSHATITEDGYVLHLKSCFHPTIFSWVRQASLSSRKISLSLFRDFGDVNHQKLLIRLFLSAHVSPSPVLLTALRVGILKKTDRTLLIQIAFNTDKSWDFRWFYEEFASALRIIISLRNTYITIRK